MVEEVKEAKEEVVETVETFDEKADKILDEMEEKKTPPESSTETKTEGEKTKTEETPTAEVDKTDKVKEVEADKSLSVEDKIGKIKEILGDDEKALDAYIKEKGYHTDPAWQKQRELIDKLKKEGSLSVEDKAKLVEMDKVTSSREYIESDMKAQGFTQEAIDNKLKEKGFEVEGSQASQNDFDLVINALKIDPKTVKGLHRNDIEDIARIARVIAESVVSSKVNDSLQPIQKFINDSSSKESGNLIVNSMEKTVKDEGILDYAKDVEPEMNKYLDANPNADQDSVFRHFTDFTRKANIERLKTGNRKEERDIKKGNLRQHTTAGAKSDTVAPKTGDFNTDADSVLDAMGVF